MEHSARFLGTRKIIIGILVLLNAFIWPQWLGVDGWISFFAVLAIIGGLMHIFCPVCRNDSCCSIPEPKKPVTKKRRR